MHVMIVVALYNPSVDRLPQADLKMIYVITAPLHQDEGI